MLFRSNTNGSLKNVTKPESLFLNLPKFKAVTTRKDLVNFVNESQLNIHLPEKIQLAGNVNGSLDNLNTKAKLTSTQGIAIIEASYKNDKTIAFNIDSEIINYKVDELLQNPNLGTLSLSIKSKGKGKTINNLDATLDAEITKFKLNDYAIKDLKFVGSVKDGEGNLSSNYKDENLNVNVTTTVKLDSLVSKANASINVIGADLQALGLMSRNVKTGMKLALDFKGNTESYQVSSNIKDGVIVYDNKTYLIGGVTANAFVDKDTTAFALKNKMIDVNLESNTDPQTFGNAIQSHILSYFYRNAKLSDTIKNPINLKLKGKISQTALLKDVFLVNVKDIDTINIDIDFKEKERQLKAKITVPHINYSGNELDSLAFSMVTDKENFDFNLGFENITAGPLDIPKTLITGRQTNNELSLNFSSSYKGEKLVNVNTKITGNRENLNFTVNPDSLLLNSKPWEIPKDNKITFTNNNLIFSKFKISKANQSIEITDNLEKAQKNHIAFVYNNFLINELFNYLNPEQEITKGILNGDFILQNPFTETGVIANLNVTNFQILKTNLGKFTINAKSLGNNSYDFNAKLKEGDIDLDLKGDYLVKNEEAYLNLNLDINKFKMQALNTLSLGEIKETSGSFSGSFNVDGTLAEPQYNGELNFSNASLNITKLNTKFTLKDENLKIDNKGLSMSNFTILDANNNKLVASGKIGTKSFINPTFNLKLNAKDFKVLNAKKEDNKDLYGVVTFNANAKLTGDLQIPKLDAKATLGAETDVTYVMPSTYANVEEREGIVVFVNRENPDAILTQTEEEVAIVKGFDISAQLKIDKKAAVTVIIDEDTGDNFKVSGDGDFIFTMVPNGRISLTGAYEIREGHYELTLYGIVNRKFLIAPGSEVSWSGDPFDANLNVKAIYKVETSASSLMASQLSNEDSSVRNRFKQVLPFQVYLNIDGELLKPKISFDLDMPEEEQGAIGGQVYGRVQQINQQEEELNKQVFSLLVLNRFYPDSGSDGASGGFSTIARDNLNEAVSGQLNAFSDKILGTSGFELDFGLNSFTDYQGEAPTDRTQLDIAAQKKLFNERLVVRVGSEIDVQGSSSTNEQTPLIGNASLEYKITEDGSYRIKGFRKSEFENVIDGQTIVSGISVIFSKEFNEFHALWKALFESSKKKSSEEKEEKIKNSKVKNK